MIVRVACAALLLTLAACGEQAPPPAPAASAPTAPQPDPATPTPTSTNLGVPGMTEPGATPPVEIASAGVAPVGAAGASATAAEVMARLSAKYPEMDVIDVEAVPNTPLFEVRVKQWGDDVGYTDAAVSYVYMAGNLFMGPVGAVVNFTEKNNNDRMYRLLAQLPFREALTYKYGAGERTLVIFEDPDCSNCQQMEAEFKQAGAALNMTVRVLPLPLAQHEQADARSRHMLCAENPELAWNEWLTSAEARKDWDAFAARYPAQAGCERAKMVDQVIAVAEKLPIDRTPVLLFDNGMTFVGRPTLEELEKAFAFVAEAKAQGKGVRPPTPDAAPAN